MPPFVSICIPSYNRPLELVRLLKTINTACAKDIEIVICENDSLQREQIVAQVESFMQASVLDVKLFLNEKNLGYDANLRRLVEKASGEFIIFMGDDDLFETENLPSFIQFLKNHPELGYVLKTHTLIHRDGTKELFKYFPEDKFFEKGVDAYQTLFRKSVLISGFCVKRAYAALLQTDQFDGTLLYQLYLLAEVTLHHPSAFCSIPLTCQDESLRAVPLFGSSDTEKSLYKPGEITVANSLNFMDGFFKITAYIDAKYGLRSSGFMKRSFSKYAYPVISIQRNKGSKTFRNYCKQLEERIDINQSFYYYIYYYSLLFFGKSFCDKMIVRLKRVLGSTPNL
ncbi:glycosyltransferase family 2 protein [Taibaiella soli]|uniref:Glycosyltransferase 2-like domain-containing protein n=1 Tax=Taibaiella soli TaxID=1649169 RepID=A0A2W2AYF9_9BACT|nr:glycosyltransferase family 2 protein [Taibaiella soli]PZF72728.1 hypothetical protein DN068_12770 [Taibaiella soli]